MQAWKEVETGGKPVHKAGWTSCGQQKSPQDQITKDQLEKNNSLVLS